MILNGDIVSRLKNEIEIDLIWNWNKNRDEINGQFSSTRKREFIEENASALRKMISSLIAFYEQDAAKR